MVGGGERNNILLLESESFCCKGADKETYIDGTRIKVPVLQLHDHW